LGTMTHDRRRHKGRGGRHAGAGKHGAGHKHPHHTHDRAGAPITGEYADPIGGDDMGHGGGGGGFVPFVEAAKEHFEGAFYDNSFTMGAATQQASVDVPAYGYGRNVWLLVVASGGTLGAGVLQADYPYTQLAQVTLVDVNGTPMYGPFDGYPLYAHNLTGGYAWSPNIASYPGVVTTINSTWVARVPIEITAWDGFGSLANLNAANAYRLRFQITPTSLNFSTAPTTPPNVRVRAYLEAWSQPPQVDHLGRANATEPPSHGTTQFWSLQTKTVAVGQNTIRLERMGNLIRTLLFICRNTTTNLPRDDSVFPDPIEIDWDAHQLVVGEPQFYRKAVQYERYGFALPTGFFCYDLTHDNDGHPGNENRNLYLPTVQATRFQVYGSVATAGNWEIYTNDVMPVPAELGSDVPGITTPNPATGRWGDQ
jgi:hypothetical protein